MKTITFDISDRDYQLLSRLAELLGLTTTQIARELVLESRHTIPAQIHFLRRAIRGRGQEQRGLALLEKATGVVSENPTYKVPNAQTRAAMHETGLLCRLSYLARDISER